MNSEIETPLPTRSAIMRDFAHRLPRHARVLDAGFGDASALGYFLEKGFRAQGIDPSPERVAAGARRGLPVACRDLRLSNYAPDSFDAIWCDRAFAKFPSEEIQRVLHIFFKALHPQAGILCLGIEVGELGQLATLEACFALLRQSGFHLLGHVKQPGSDGADILYTLSKRVG